MAEWDLARESGPSTFDPYESVAFSIYPSKIK